jgi:hypothetical protein
MCNLTSKSPLSRIRLSPASGQPTLAIGRGGQCIALGAFSFEAALARKTTAGKGIYLLGITPVILDAFSVVDITSLFLACPRLGPRKRPEPEKNPSRPRDIPLQAPRSSQFD